MLHALWRRAFAPASPLPPRSAARTHVGRVRSVNEDRVFDRPDRGLWAVADGMGGHEAGDVAAAMTVDALAALADDPGPITAASIEAALHGANARIAHGRSGASGTTVVALWIAGTTAALFWAGDSRAYLIRRGRASALTRDHSVVQDLVDAGAISERQAACHGQANVITRALGIADAVAIDRAAAALRPGDRVLLCSDGLHRSLDERDLADPPPLDAFATRLLFNALQRDGSDNASLVLVEI